MPDSIIKLLVAAVLLSSAISVGAAPADFADIVEAVRRRL